MIIILFDIKIKIFCIIKVGLSEENTDGIKEKIIELYRDLNGIDIRSAQNQFAHHISQTNTYGMIDFELKVLKIIILLILSLFISL